MSQTLSAAICGFVLLPRVGMQDDIPELAFSKAFLWWELTRRYSPGKSDCDLQGSESLIFDQMKY